MRPAVLFYAFIAAGCLSPPPRTAHEYSAYAGEGEEVAVTFPDGTRTSTIEEYEAKVSADTPEAIEMSQTAITLSLKPTDAGGRSMGLGNFRISILPDYSYLRECVSASFLHLKVVVTSDKVPAPLLELHLVAWFRGGEPCFAVVNTGAIGYGWCQRYCVSAPKVPKADVKTAVKNGLVSAGISAGVAGIIAALAAPVAVAALAL